MTTNASAQDANVEVASARQQQQHQDNSEPLNGQQICGEDIGDNEEICKASATQRDIEQQPYEDKIEDTSDNLREASSRCSETALHKANICWMQSDSRISLKIYLQNVTDFSIQIQDTCDQLIFKGTVEESVSSQQGTKTEKPSYYHIELNFYSKVNKQTFHCRLKRYVIVQLEKLDQREVWPTLTRTHESEDPDWIQQKPSYIPDSNYWSPSQEDSEDSSNSDNENTVEFLQGSKLINELLLQIEGLQKQRLSETNYRQDEQAASRPCAERQANEHSLNLEKAFENSNKIQEDIFNPFKRRRNGKRTRGNMKYDYRKESNIADTSKNTARQAMDLKKTYLFLYNLLMFVVFLMVNLILIIKCVSGTIDDDSITGAAFIIKVLTYTQLLESIHPMLGLVPGGPLMPFTQVIGRLLVNHFLSEPTIRLESAPFAHYLFIVWSSIEIFRYSFYALRVFKVDIYPITWCRYTLFMPLYPMGGFCESMIIFATIRRYEKTGEYSISLPNSANVSFSLPVALRIYTFLLLGPTIFVLMRYMWSQRCKQLKEKVA